MITSHPRGPRAFTLVELLTVIAIIAVLAAILIPVTAKIRENAATTKCVANLRTWHNATQLYVADNKGKLPVSRYIQGATINGIYQSGIAQDAYLYLNRYVLAPNQASATWGYNQTENEPSTCTNRDDAGNGFKWGAYGFNYYASELSLAGIGSPARLVWATEAANANGGQRWLEPAVLAAGSANLLGTPIKPHGSRNNILYLDGHVVTKPIGELMRADFTRESSAYSPAHESQRLGG